MLTSKQITDLVGADPNEPGTAGKVHYVRRSLTPGGMGARVGPASHHALMDDLAAQHPAGTATAEQQYRHPAADAKAHAPGRGGAPLTPSDLAWLNRLPVDPTRVSYDAASTLAGLASSLSGTQHTSDRRLVESVWSPVRELHDGAAAGVALAAAQRPAPPVPSSALQALSDAIAAEVPTLQPAEALSRAGAALREALDKRATVRQQKAADARDAIARAQAAAAARTATTR